MTENEYWSNRSNQDRIYGDLQHQENMYALVTNSEYALFNSLRPRVFKDGNQFCVMYGDNIQEGICGFGDSPHQAVIDFNKNWNGTT